MKTIQEKIEEQVLALEQLKELVQFSSSQVDRSNDPDPWKAIYRYLDDLTTEIDVAVCDLRMLTRRGGCGMATTPTTPEPRDLGDIAISLDCTVTDLEAFRELIDFIFYRDGSADDELASPLAALRNALRAIVADFGGIQAELSDYRRRTKEGGAA